MNDPDTLAEKLDVLIKLQAGWMAKDFSHKNEKVLFLASAGLPNKLIAELVDSTPHSVSQTIYTAKKKAENGKGK